MITLRFCRVPVPIGAALFLLAGCGGMQPQVGSATTGQAVQAGGSLQYSRTFRYEGNQGQWFTVPAHLTRLTVVALGASGGSNFSRFNLELGGRGGRIYAVIPVTSGERLEVVVGGEGSQPAGGFNGGASGGVYGGRFSGQGGGGASDVRQGGRHLANRILVAGGGGGHGAPLEPDNCYSEPHPEATYYPPDGNGGKGGGSTGGSGQVGCGGYGSGGGAAGGSQHSGGQGGAGGQGVGNPGNPGSLGRGGIGGAGCHGTACGEPGEPGGGGGGGYFGGGGGGAGNSTDIDALGGGGGGGGSSYIEPSAQKFQSWQGWYKAVGDGLVVFSWR